MDLRLTINDLRFAIGGWRLAMAAALAGTIQLEWVAQPTWLCCAATCRTEREEGHATQMVRDDLAHIGGLVARQHGPVAHATRFELNRSGLECRIGSVNLRDRVSGGPLGI